MIYQKTKKYSGNELLTNTNKTKINHNQHKINRYVNGNVNGKHSGGGGNTLGNKLFGTSISNNQINYDKFDIATKEQYNQLKKDVRATRISAFFARKLRRITEEQYKLQLRLLWANLFFAKIWLKLIPLKTPNSK